MPAILVLAFVVVPLIELVAIIQVGQLIGTGWTIALLVADSLLGAFLLKRESRRAWQDFRAALSSGRWPGDEVTQGGLVIVGGALLLTPGFVTDAVGLLCLLPPSRAVASRMIRRRLGPGVVLGGADTTRAGGTVGGTRARGAAAPDQGGRGRTRDAGADGPNVLDVEVLGVEREPPRDPAGEPPREPPPPER
jgi:UPF0716 protein FxsA